MTDPTTAPADRPPGRPRVRLELTGSQETLLIALYSKALDYRSARSILHDRKADEIARSLDYDFDRIGHVAPGSLLAARSKQLDDWVLEFLDTNPNAIVLNVGCGLDTRYFRLQPSPALPWIDLDVPSVIDLRHRFFEEKGGYRMVGASLTDPDWLEQLPKDRAVVVVADGVLEYLSRNEVAELFRRIVGHFPRGQLVFDVMNSTALRQGNPSLRARTGAELRWAVDDLSEVDGIDPRLHRVSVIPLFGSRYLPWQYRFVGALARLVPSTRNMIRLLRYEF